MDWDTIVALLDVAVLVCAVAVFPLQFGSYVTIQRRSRSLAEQRALMDTRDELLFVKVAQAANTAVETGGIRPDAINLMELVAMWPLPEGEIRERWRDTQLQASEVVSSYRRATVTDH